MKNRRLLLYIFFRLAILLVLLTNGINASSCSVNPTESVVIVGEMTSIDCFATGSDFVDSWIQGKAVTEGIKVYQMSAYRRDGTIRVNESLANGYFLSYKDDHQITLQMNETTRWQAGPYFCKCDGNIVGVARANVGVVDFLPSFTPRPRKNIIEGDRVDFICSISFNGSANSSFHLFINDSNGKTISRQLSLPFLIDKKSYQVNHSVIADPMEDQTFTCTVKVINGSSKSAIYSKTVNASLLWEPVSKVFINCSTKFCSPGDELRCNANGRPRPTVFKWWKNSNNGKLKERLMENNTEYFVLDEIGNFTYRCYAYNVIRNVTYEAFSSDFNVKVEEQRVLKNSVVIGAIVGTLIFILIVVFFVIFFWARKRKHQSVISSAFVSTDPKNREIHTYNQQECAKKEISKTNQQGSSTPNKVDSEVVLCDNELYGAANLQLDPSDGYAAEMPYYASINKM